MHVAQYKIKYSPNTSSRGLSIPRHKINSTHKWVEYSLDIHDMSRLLVLTKCIDEKFALMQALDVAERKRAWHYKQENFNMQHAKTILQATLRASRDAVKKRLTTRA